MAFFCCGVFDFSTDSITALYESLNDAIRSYGFSILPPWNYTLCTIQGRLHSSQLPLLFLLLLQSCRIDILEIFLQVYLLLT